MKVEFLGTGGAITTPKPFCGCRVCDQARKLGRPYSRSGPSVFVHGPDALIDTPEESRDQLNRSTVRAIKAGFYSHWHPDHVMGRRVWEINHDWRNWPPRHHRTPVYLPAQVARDFRTRLGSWQHLEFFATKGLIELVELAEGQRVMLGDCVVEPIRLAEDYVYAFMFTQGQKRLMVVMDELVGWDPPAEVRGVDLAVVPIGIMEFHPLTGERLMPVDHPTLKSEATFLQTLDIARKLEAKHLAFTHFEEPDGLSHDDHAEMERILRSHGRPITMAFDGLMLEV